MSRRPIGDRPMTNTQRSHRHRDRLREQRARKEEITERYFGGRPPLSPKERPRLLSEMGWLLEVDVWLRLLISVLSHTQLQHQIVHRALTPEAEREG